MFAQMMASGGGGGDAYTATPYGFTAYSSRWTYKSGGFRVKDGVCYVDMVLTANTNLNANQTMFSVTNVMPASAQGTSWVEMGDIKVRYNASISDAFYTVSSKSSGADITIVGQYLTNAPDSEVQV